MDANTVDYLKNYNNCKVYCGSDDDDPDDDIDLLSCVNTIKDNDSSLCSKNAVESDCSTIYKESFKSFLYFLVKFLKILYCSRHHYGNTYDLLFITSLGTLDLDKFSLTYDELMCVKLQDFVKPGMPNNLGDYLLAIKEIQRILSSSTHNLVTSSKHNAVLMKFPEFVLDFQPWSTLLVKCVQNYIKQLELPLVLPDIEDISKYGEFIAKCNKKDIDTFIASSNPLRLIYLFIETTRKGGTLRRHIPLKKSFTLRQKHKLKHKK
jgi:hypothetical protein